MKHWLSPPAKNGVGFKVKTEEGASLAGFHISIMKALILILFIATSASAKFRVQEDFIADDWSKYHVAGGVVSYVVFRESKHPFLYSLGIATAWEIGDAFKPTKDIYGDWRSHVLVADGFSYSYIVYHMAGTYLTWLVLDASSGKIVFTLRYEK